MFKVLQLIELIFFCYFRVGFSNQRQRAGCRTLCDCLLIVFFVAVVFDLMAYSTGHFRAVSEQFQGQWGSATCAEWLLNRLWGLERCTGRFSVFHWLFPSSFGAVLGSMGFGNLCRMVAEPFMGVREMHWEVLCVPLVISEQF